MKKDTEKNLKKQFFKSILLSPFFKFIIFFMLTVPGIFFGALLVKFFFFACIEKWDTVGEITEILYKFGTPYAAILLYIINFGNNSAKK